MWIVIILICVIICCVAIYLLNTTKDNTNNNTNNTNNTNNNNTNNTNNTNQEEIKKPGIYMAPLINESTEIPYENTILEEEAIDCSKSKLYVNNNEESCYNIKVNQIYLVYCEDYDGSPKDYTLKGMNGDCPGRKHIILYKDGKYMDPKVIKDKNGNIIKLKDLKADLGGDVSFLERNLIPSDISFADVIITDCGLQYKLNINDKCIFVFNINQNL